MSLTSDEVIWNDSKECVGLGICWCCCEMQLEGGVGKVMATLSWLQA